MADVFKIWYRAPEVCDLSYYPFDLGWDQGRLENPQELAYIAKECGEDYFHNQDGYDDPWPVVISLHRTEGSEELARFLVSVEMEPRFSAESIPEDKSPKE